MKALTLWQPWATLMFTPVREWGIAKRFETRSRPWNHRGFVAIHAAKVIPKEAAALTLTSPFFETIGNIYNLQFGVIIGLVWMERCMPVKEALLHPGLNPLEKQFGNYSPGRYAYYCPFARKLKEPVNIGGHQGIWNWQENQEAIESMAEIRRVFKGQINGTESWP